MINLRALEAMATGEMAAILLILAVFLSSCLCVIIYILYIYIIYDTDFHTLMDPIYDMMQDTQSREPFTDLYDTITGNYHMIGNVFYDQTLHQSAMTYVSFCNIWFNTG